MQCLTHFTPLPPSFLSLSLPSLLPLPSLFSPPFPSPPFLPSLPHFTHILVEYCHSGAVERVSRGLQNFSLSATTLTYTTLLPAQHTHTNTHGVEDQDQDRVIIVFYKQYQKSRIHEHNTIHYIYNVHYTSACIHLDLVLPIIPE